MVLFFVEEVLLGEDEVGGEEDVEAEGIEEGVEGGGGEGGRGAWRVDCQQLLLVGDGVGWAVPCFRRVGVVVKVRVWEMRRWRQGRQ